MKKRLTVKVFGRVQGVFFRAHTKEWATQLGLTGWVKNIESDGVELVAEGEEEKLNELLSKVKVGPAPAKVEKIDYVWSNFSDEFSDFSIRY